MGRWPTLGYIYKQGSRQRRWDIDQKVLRPSASVFIFREPSSRCFYYIKPKLEVFPLFCRYNACIQFTRKTSQKKFDLLYTTLFKRTLFGLFLEKGM